MTHPGRRGAALAGALLLAVALTGPALAARPDHQKPKPPGAQAVHMWLTVLHNNDGESKLLGAGSGALADYGGIARFKTVVDNLKYEATELRPATQRGGKRGVVMLSSGDNFLAGVELTASFEKGVPWYDSIGLDMVGYDAMAIGNHEFDFGPEALGDFISGFASRTPFVSANLDVSGEPVLAALAARGRIVASTVVRERGELIGIVGATTPQLPNISSPRDAVADPAVAEAIQGQVDRLERRGVNKIILISHLQSAEEDIALAAMLDGVDVMIAGGGDELLANDGDLLVPGDVRSDDLPYPLWAVDSDGTDVPVVTTAGDYKYVGRLSVGFDKRGNLVRIDESTSGPVRVSGVGEDAVEPDPEVQARVADPVAEFVADLAANVIATSEVALEGRRGGGSDPNITTPGIRNSETNLANLTADSLLWAAQRNAAAFGVDAPQVGMQNSGGIRNNSLIAAGSISELNTFQILAFLNFVSVKEDMSADQLKAVLETSVSDVGSNGRFSHFSGLRFTYNPAAQRRVIDGTSCAVSDPGARVQDVFVGGTQVFDDGVFVGPVGWTVDFATNDFTFRGGDCFDFGPGGFTSVGVTYQQALADYLQAPVADGGLGGVISGADYPEGGEGRIARL